ncbi:hypothetical protein HAX54_021328, partial [Datura stramonium]|nr:hypothetical protein [Datura stramonium]
MSRKRRGALSSGTRSLRIQTPQNSSGVVADQILRVQLCDMEQGLASVSPFQCTYAIASCLRAFHRDEIR